MLYATLLLACATKYDNTAHGGGSLRVVVEPSDPMAAGIRTDTTFQGATPAELQQVADDGTTPGSAMLSTSNERGSDYTDAWLTAGGPAEVTGTDCTLDTVTVLISSYSETMQLLVDDGDVGDVTTFLQDLPLQEAVAATGSVSGTLALRVQPFSGFEEVAPCWGPDPVDHDVLVEWSFDEVVEWTERVPWDPSPDLY